MNQKLQQLLDSIQQSGHLSVDEKDALTKKIKEVDKEIEITSFKLEHTEKVKRTTAILLEETIEELEQKRKAIEATYHELEIESSLERVRTVAMSMIKPDNMPDVCKIISQQLELLQVKEIRNVQTAIFYKEKGTYVNYEYYAKHDKTFITETSYTNSEIHTAFAAQMMKGAGEFFSTNLNEKEVKEWIAYQKTTNVFIDDFLYNASSLNYYWNSLGPVALGISTYAPLEQNDTNLFNRFVKVFELAYRRYLDIEKAEAQSREAMIELALEKVRSRAMAMQNSNELAVIVDTIFKELTKLNVLFDRCLIMIYDPKTLGSTWWLANPEPAFAPVGFLVKYHEHKPYLDYIKVWKDRTLKWEYVLEGTDKKEWDEFVFAETELSLLPAPVIAGMKSFDRIFLNVSFNNFGSLTASSVEPIQEEHFDILLRFAKVFDSTYTRFNDLQKAEAQAREAQIEVALEKIRSRSLGMHQSVEIKDVVSVLFEKLKELDLVFDGGAAIHLFTEGSRNAIIWVASTELTEPSCINLPYDEDAFENNPIITDVWHAKETGEHIYNKSYSFEEKNIYFNYVFKHNDFIAAPKPVREFILQADSYTTSFIAEKNSLLGANSWTGQLFSADDFEILRRIARVLEQAYTRFHDLQKAESQAKEAQIELGLERVRARAMAMQKSDELADAAQLLYREFGNLDINTFSCGYMFVDEAKHTQTAWVVLPDGSLLPNFIVFPLNGDQVLDSRYKDWKEKKPIHVFEIQGEANKKHHRFLANYVPPFVVDDIFSKIPDRIIFNCANFSDGYLLILASEHFSPEEQQTIIRFAKVFEMTYTRFNDLKQAEAQAREAKIEAALERVRSRTLAMQKSNELAETAAVLFKQLILLGIEPNRLYINIIKNETGESEFWITDEDGSKVSSAFELNMNDNPSFKKMFTGWKEKKKSLVIDMSGKELKEYFQHLGNLHVPFKEGLAQKRRLQYIAYFNKGFIGMASPDEQPEETMNLLERFAAVFNLTFTRFNDLKMAEAHAIQAEEDLVKLHTEKRRAEDALSELQLTQKQLIQSEKMASLGELTAGIAHEIQNPLNFVNNFSEVSNELLDEMIEEVAKGNYEEVKAIADDVKQNLEKINHHGKRADAIVKGMLQHSRNSSSAAKEPTDINKLADEYLRLAYHGLRAKDKSFNATMKTDFDEPIGNINIIPQDIGRVILNLITNAFYVVNEKSKQGITGYEPTVSLSTKKENNKVLITVKDNGNGISQKILDKIFQPFFTTKPTGQGTGLGLSLSYDIVKAHGGELKVETKEGEGSEFIIQL